MTHFTDIDNAYRKITARANMLYEFVILYHNYIYGKHTYEAENCNMMQIHTLKMCIRDRLEREVNAINIVA